MGIRLFSKPLQLTLFRRRVFSGEALMSIDKGVENGLANASSSPWQFAPTRQQQLEWPKWGQYFETKGMAGRASRLALGGPPEQLYEHGLARPRRGAAAVWHEILQIWADEVFSIGTVAGVLQPVVVSNRLRNIPGKGIYNWDPGAFFGIYKPDHFWFGHTGPGREIGIGRGAPGASLSRLCGAPCTCTPPAASRNPVAGPFAPAQPLSRRLLAGVMLGYIVNRLLIMVPTLIAISIVIFTIINLPPGNYFTTYVASCRARAKPPISPRSNFSKTNMASTARFGSNTFIGWADSFTATWATRFLTICRSTKWSATACC